MSRKEGTKRKRKGRGIRPETSVPKANAFVFSPPSARRPDFAYLDRSGLARLKRRAFKLLSRHGIALAHPEAVRVLEKAGAKPAGKSGRYRLPKELVEEALAETPKTLRLCGKHAARDLELPRADRSFVMRTGTGAHGYVDPRDGSYRNLQIGDVAEIAALGNHLDQVGFIAHPFVYGVPELTADIHGFASLIARTDKHVWIQPHNRENVEYLMRIAAVAAGGESALRQRPLASCITCSFSPLEFKAMDVECIIQSGRFGLPLHACALPSAGGTAPALVPGLVLMAVAEILAMVTLAHLLAPGIPVIATPLMFALDMRTGRALQSSVEARMAATMAIQAVKQGFGLVSHTYGAGSDTPDVDMQSMAERALLGQEVALAGADILGGVGQLESATVFSPVQAVLDDELGSQLRRYLKVDEIDSESLNWPEISAIRAGGHFLDSGHTLKYCRDQLSPRAFLRLGRDDYEASGRRTAFEQAREICLALIARPAPDHLPDEMAREEIAKIVSAADRHILAAAGGTKGAAEI